MKVPVSFLFFFPPAFHGRGLSLLFFFVSSIIEWNLDLGLHFGIPFFFSPFSPFSSLDCVSGFWSNFAFLQLRYSPVGVTVQQFSYCNHIYIIFHAFLCLIIPVTVTLGVDYSCKYAHRYVYTNICAIDHPLSLHQVKKSLAWLTGPSFCNLGVGRTPRYIINRSVIGQSSCEVGQPRQLKASCQACTFSHSNTRHQLL